MFVFFVVYLCSCRRSKRRERYDFEMENEEKSQVGALADYFKRIGIKERGLNEDSDMTDKLVRSMKKYSKKDIKKAMKKRGIENLRRLMKLNIYDKYGLDGLVMTQGLDSKASALVPYLISANVSKGKRKDLIGQLSKLYV